ncbi:MAG: hypothetical protein M3279_09165 [Actinomycetota bacterium]|nr:hypothetical protein [Actinomycetota bacterium]
MKRLVVAVASIALVASGLMAPVAAKQTEPPPQPTEVPESILIEDPFGDANFLGGDNTTLPADGGSQTDIGKVWFSHDATNFQVHILTEGPPTSNSLGFMFEVVTGPDGCLLFEGITKGQTYLSDNLARVTDACNELERLAEGTHVVFAAGPGDEGGLVTITVPRSYSPLLADGSILDGSIARSRIFVGGEQITATGYRGVHRLVDDTKPGVAYTVTPAGGEEPEEKLPPGCKKGKGKKKGCKKKGG